MTKDEKVIKDIVASYGKTLDLKKNPYVIVEIIRQFGPRLGGLQGAECLPPGGPPHQLDPSEIIKELKARASELSKLSVSLEKALADKGKNNSKAVSTGRSK